MKKVLCILLFIITASCSMGKVEKRIDNFELKEARKLEDVLKTLYNNKNFVGITELYNKQKDDFDKSELMLYVIRAYYYLEQYNEVINLIENYQKIFKKIVVNEIELVKFLGISHYKLGNINQAQRFLEIAFKDDKSEEIIKYLTLVYMKKGQYSLALIITTNLPEGKREFIQGLIYMRMKNWKKALDLFKQTKNKYRKAYVFIGYCHYMMGNIEEAEKVINDSQLQSDTTSKFIIALIMIDKGYVKKGKLMLEELKIQENNASYTDYIKYNLELIDELYFENLGITKKNM